MRLSKYFLPVSKEAPSDAAIASHQLMLRTGMVRQNGAGIYTWLPLGLRVLKKIEQIVREEMNRAGAVEMLMPTLQQADLWRESGRYEAYGKEMLRITDRHDRDMLYGPTNEELVTDVFRSYVKSYKQLPLNLYHQQWKFRDEIRPRFGVMRGREFMMKDAYSFDLTADDARHSYNRMFCAYLNTFSRLGLTGVPMRADTGPIGGELSHEFIILAETGESAVFCDKTLLDMPAPGLDLDFTSDLTAEVEKRTQYYAATEEMHDEAAFAELPEDRKVSARGIEVGHIFYFGTKYSEPMNAVVQGPDGQMVPVEMGSYGIGVSRLVGGIIEACHDENGIVWPESVAPFQVGIINMRVGDEECDTVCEQAYQALELAGIDTLYDETDDRAGGKFARMDLIGLPWQIVIGPRGIKNGVVEVKNRKTGEKSEMPLADALSKVRPE
ncbi:MULTISPECIES: proline--tRNA ligase [unclassified Hyphomonas]|jgi:prolyl-tRNA synthetase|uniref:proline--tRNA ligase n=2 Tax=root TaxID=1 RepID=A0A160TW89_9ZZZZ|nr:MULTISPECIES: proline--tRNA ligase [unclassified Hyphomonas]MAA83087.1 proline--tRNA ligase [Hyphomonas sp.]MAL47812.1 proline--tRNA ligase [Hyphomonas sp.]MAX85184.1 proline--tRNA ligase [Hyphomonas sp.]MBG66289.1 proline--tRNA ligase [Hyphomonas sp.]MBO6583552.1 proline--tRNA ligase [Hyphomonas sp.]|tara:strand:+ start:31067 stop:32386 length:1320 start_codon:yes stop_codon:yes gene_type:complete